MEPIDNTGNIIPPSREEQGIQIPHQNTESTVNSESTVNTEPETPRSWWRRIMELFTNRNIDQTEQVNEVRNEGNTFTLFIDRYISRRHCPYCFGYVSKRVFRERSRPDQLTRVSGVRLGLPNLKIYECPHPHCRKPLPGDFFENRGASIAVVGGRDAGKSSFITIFCELLINRNSILSELGIFGSILNEEGKAQFNKNRWMLIDKNSPLPTTLDRQETIVVRLQSRHSSNCIYISLIDNPGEQFEEVNTLTERHANLQYADAIVFLMNPLDITGITQLIEEAHPGTTPALNQRDAVPNFDIIENLYKTYIATGRISPNAPIKQPTAFCISRADLIEDVSSLYIPSDFEVEFKEVEDILEEMELVADDLYELLEETDKRLLLMIDRSFGKYRLFPVSPLGKTPIGQSGGAILLGGVDPKGVLQPFIWILKEMNFIK